MSPDFRNGYIASYIAEVEQHLGEFKVTVSYVGTAAVRLASLFYPNGYGGADPEFAVFTRFDSTGRVIGGFGPFSVMASPGHSTFHSLQASVQKTSSSAGLGFQASYTFGKALDDTSNAYRPPQNPSDWRAEKGLSTFDVTHNLGFSVSGIAAAGKRASPSLTGSDLDFGLEVDEYLSADQWSSFYRFFGSAADRLGLAAGGPARTRLVIPICPRIARSVSDYFGLGNANASYFKIPIGLPGGTGPNQGRHGTLGRNTFRGPAFYNFDFSLIKDTLDSVNEEEVRR